MKYQLLPKLRWGLVILFLVSSLVFANLAYSNNSEFNRLEQILTGYGFIVKQEIPPKINNSGLRPYGLMNSKTKTIWINPVVFELGNARSVLIHEAVHAAQTCAGKGQISLVNLDLEPPQFTRPYFMRYHSYRREIEAQAYTVQVQPDSLAIVIELLEQNCS
ncbi:hypothetical protein Xen7305DRAFT_00018450 [Xenococcus sp. PCC 7305]|uniref:hypothetical protein n=1 Tax=Xenococcus sp. PCC 7305 TaxID=102125 RepID=UPI0002AC5D46|nr:hypothetical protein [Xenococcus sp. PCC 7305]ELS02134.1 hypothetical protein Xen7305DRAFT_00018450 [Xenococcus sp. PCC 7305]